MQFFGSTVERFDQDKKAKKKKDVPQVGPGSYNIEKSLLKNQTKLSNLYSGFQSNQQRFSQPALKDPTPGPGQYKPKSIVDEIKNKVSTRLQVFGTTQKRFLGQNSEKDQKPGPGEYFNGEALSIEQRAKSQVAMRSKVGSTAGLPQSMRAQQNIKNGKLVNNARSELQAQSYLQQNIEAAKLASKNY